MAAGDAEIRMAGKLKSPSLLENWISNNHKSQRKDLKTVWKIPD